MTKIESIGKVFEKSNEVGEDDSESLPPIRNKATTVILDPKNTKTEVSVEKVIIIIKSMPDLL